MKISVRLAAYAALSSLELVSSYPGMGDALSEIKRLAKTKRDDSGQVEMIGDLIKGSTSAIGTTVKNCLLGETPCFDDTKKVYVPPGTLGSQACAKDKCCVWEWLGRELQSYFLHRNSRCNQHARAAIRLAFHDSAAWSRTSGYGGADGSMLLSRTEISRPENKGLQAIQLKAIELHLIYGMFGVGAADLIQFMATVAIVTCPLGPRVRTFVGRYDSQLSPTGLIPNVNSNATTLIKLFDDKTITPEGLVALIGAHTTSNQFYVNPKRAGAPQDTTPGIWDVSFYSEVLSGKPAPKVYQLASDLVLSNATQTSGIWHEFTNSTAGQNQWNLEFSKAFVRLSLLGVYNINNLTDCTKVLPTQVNVYPTPPKPKTNTNKNNDDGDIFGPYEDYLSSVLTDGMMGYL